MARVSACGVSGATSQSCKVTQAILNVHDQPESLRRRPAIVNTLRPVKFKTISKPWILDAWHQWRSTGHVVTRDFWPFSAVCLTVFLFEVWPQTCTIALYGKKTYRIRNYDFGVQFHYLAAAELRFTKVRGFAAITYTQSPCSTPVMPEENRCCKARDCAWRSRLFLFLIFLVNMTQWKPSKSVNHESPQ